jgi:arginyl-tRNA synthetase
MYGYSCLEKFISQTIVDEWGISTDVSLIPPADDSHGDLTTSVAFSLAKILKKSPLAIAETLAKRIKQNPLVQKVEVVTGHVNMTLVPEVWNDTLRDIFTKGIHYGHHQWGQGHKANIEYVSANPTGPLHAAHSRGAILGDAIAHLLEAVGYQVTREYFINDAGMQVKALAQTVYLHCQALARGDKAVIPPGLYPGEYGEDIARTFIHEHPQWQSMTSDDLFPLLEHFSVQEMMNSIQKDLHELGIHHDLLVSERSLHENKSLDEVVALLENKELIYEGTLPPPRGGSAPEALKDQEPSHTPLLLFRSTHFGDTQDRPLKRSGGEWTYFAGDAAYHLDKVRRGYDLIIDVWGADHDSHVQRIKSVTKALSDQDVEVVICQMVHFFQNGHLVKMSKRSGTFVTLADILHTTGKDALRFMMLTKKSDSHLDLDLDLMKQHHKDNPVFYVGYAHARCCSVLRAAQHLFSVDELSPPSLGNADFSKIIDPQIIKIMADWPRQVTQAARTREPHRITTYLYRLAQAFHALWQHGSTEASLRFLQPENLNFSYAQVALVQAVAYVLASGLKILGVHAPEEMR